MPPELMFAHHGPVRAIAACQWVTQAQIDMDIDMKNLAKIEADIAPHCPLEYLVHVYTHGGRLLSEYTVNARRHHIEDIDGAEEYARDIISSTHFGASIVIVSSEIAESLEQVHINVAANYLT